MSDLKLGSIIITPQNRDAIHIAVAPLSAACRLHAGDHIGLVNGSQTEATNFAKELIGIVDPYLRTHVNPGERFWMFLYPQTVTGLRHDWSHPAFEAKAPNLKSPLDISRVWLAEYASKVGITYDELMTAAEAYISSGSYLCEGSRFSSEYVPEEFWPHYEAASGVKVEETKRGSFFSCSC